MSARQSAEIGIFTTIRQDACPTTSRGERANFGKRFAVVAASPRSTGTLTGDLPGGWLEGKLQREQMGLLSRLTMSREAWKFLD